MTGAIFISDDLVDDISNDEDDNSDEDDKYDDGDNDDIRD